MAATDRYSRLVFRLKLALPLVALAILSTLFFVAESLDPEAAIPYAEVDVARILEEQGISNASLGGVTSDGVAISVAARKIRTDPSQTVLLGETLTAVLNMPDGSRIDIASPVRHRRLQHAGSHAGRGRAAREHQRICRHHRSAGDVAARRQRRVRRQDRGHRASRRDLRRVHDAGPARFRRRTSTCFPRRG